MVAPSIRLVRADHPFTGGEHIATLRATTRGRITIPKRVRDILGLQAGDRLGFEKQSDGSYLITKSGPKSTRGSK
jgi:AbrB family looped-hinge helix DNA binding protein